MKARILFSIMMVVMLATLLVWAVQADNAPPRLHDDTPALAATPVSVQEVDKAGIIPTFNAASADAAGNVFTNDGHTILYIKNGNTETITATLDVIATTDGLAVTDRTITVTASGEKVAGPFLPEIYNNTSTGKATVTWSGTTTVTFAVLAW